MADREGIDYEVALAEVGFDRDSVARGVRRVERETREGSYLGFESLVRSLRIGGGVTALREHHIEPVIRRVEAQEAAAQLAKRRGQAALRTAANIAEQDDRRRAAAAALRQSNGRLAAVLEQMTDDEYNGRTPMRPKIEEQWRELYWPDGSPR